MEKTETQGSQNLQIKSTSSARHVFVTSILSIPPDASKVSDFSIEDLEAKGWGPPQIADTYGQCELPLEWNASQFEEFIHKQFPKLINYELFKSTKSKRLIKIPANINTPARLKETGIGPSGFYIRPLGNIKSTEVKCDTIGSLNSATPSSRNIYSSSIDHKKNPEMLEKLICDTLQEALTNSLSFKRYIGLNAVLVLRVDSKKSINFSFDTTWYKKDKKKLPKGRNLDKTTTTEGGDSQEEADYDEAPKDADDNSVGEENTFEEGEMPEHLLDDTTGSELNKENEENATIEPDDTPGKKISLSDNSNTQQEATQAMPQKGEHQTDQDHGKSERNDNVDDPEEPEQMPDSLVINEEHMLLKQGSNESGRKAARYSKRNLRSEAIALKKRKNEKLSKEQRSQNQEKKVSNGKQNTKPKRKSDEDLKIELKDIEGLYSFLPSTNTNSESKPAMPANAGNRKRNIPKKRFKCNFCNKEFSAQCHLRRHLSKHVNARNFSCSICNKTFNSLVNVKRHQVVHQNQQNHICDECGESFLWKGSFQRHMMKHRGIRPHVCTVCDKSFITAYDLKAHLKLHSGLKEYICSDCGMQFSRSSGLNIHMRTVHSEVRKFQCPTCEKCFKLKSALARHMRNHTGKSQYVCNVCGQGFKWHTSRTLHMKKHEKQTSKPMLFTSKDFQENTEVKVQNISNEDPQIAEAMLQTQDASANNKLLSDKQPSQEGPGFYQESGLIKAELSQSQIQESLIPIGIVGGPTSSVGTVIVQNVIPQSTLASSVIENPIMIQPLILSQPAQIVKPEGKSDETKIFIDFHDI